MIEPELTTEQIIKAVGLAILFSITVGILLWEVIKGILDNWRT